MLKHAQIIEEFVDHFHHGKEEKAYFPDTKEKDGFSEDIRKFLIEHELGRRIAMMLRRELKEWKEKLKQENSNNSMVQEPVARFLKSYTVFIDDHTGKELSSGGEARIQEMIRLIEYLEEREWMKE